MSRWPLRLTLLFAVVGGLAACQSDEPLAIGTKDVGDDCRQISDCRPGLECASGRCQVLPPLELAGRAGSACLTTADCAEGLCCGNQGLCRSPPPGGSSESCGQGEGGPCGFSADCSVGLVCDGSGLCARPGGQGQGELGSGCAEIADCRRPLICGVDDTCVEPPLFPGARCVRSEEERGAFRAYFEVPRGEPLDEFYRLPFPSDVRVRDGVVDLGGHASPGEILGVDFTALYLGAIVEDMRGFGLSQPIFFRFSEKLDAATLTATAALPSVLLVDVTSGSPDYGRAWPVEITYRESAGQFICGNAVGIAPQAGRPLRPGTTYAAVLGHGLRAASGAAPIQDGDLRVVLAEAAPSEPAALVAAHAAFAPLRAYLTGAGRSLDTVAAATVFTTGEPGAVAPRIREAVRGVPDPVASELTRCAAGVTSPCAEGASRGCAPADPAYEQLHFRLRFPKIQRGTRPYLSPGLGREGALSLDADGRPEVFGDEGVCVSLAVPRNAPPPAGGWPVVLYAHGTGGDFTSALGSVASDLAALGIATIGYDGVMHGPRQGLPPEGRQDPGRLFFNPGNPRAARDNVMQGAADLFYLVRAAEALLLPRAATGLPADVRFDATRIGFYGHSQGTVVAPPFLAWERGVRAAVLTGAGAELGITFVEKRKPNDTAGLVRVAFGDQSPTRIHPMIGLLTWYFGSTDALPYAGLWVARRPVGRGPLDLLHVYGVGDGYTPDATQAALARAGGWPLVGALLAPIDGVPRAESGLTANLDGATAGTIQFAPPISGGVPEYDGHFVGTRAANARQSISRFFGALATGSGRAVIQR